MKKIFSFMLIAAGLLISGQVKAAVTPTPVSSETELRNAISGTGVAVGATINIQLTGNVVLENGPINIWAGKTEDGKNVTIDLNGHSISSESWNLFNLFKGKLTINGTGAVGEGLFNTCTVFYNQWKDVCINVFGSPNMDDADWSVLTIGENVKLQSTTTNTKGKDGHKAIQVYVTEDSYFTSAYGIKEVKDDLSLRANQYYYTKTTTAQDENGKTYDTYGAVGSKKPSPQHAFGVVVNVENGAELFGEEYGIQVTGNIKDVTGNVPVINIKSGAVVRASSSITDCAGIYACAGQWNISGTVTGCTGIYIKGGTVNLVDATVASTATDYTAVEERGTTALGGAGVKAGGSAIVCETNVTYAYDAIELNISGNTTVTAASGYAVEGVISTNAAWSESNMTIESGTISGGNLGVFNLAGAVSQQVIDNASIQGGTYSHDITNLLNQNTGIVTQAENENGDIVYTISQKEPGQVFDTIKVNADWSNVGENSLVVVKSGVETTLPASVSAQYIAVQSGATIIVPDGKTLTAGEIVMGAANAVLDVKAGGIVKITSTQGLISNNASSLILECSAQGDGKFAQFLLAPNVETNTNPKATVEFVTKSFCKSANDLLWERLALPTIMAVEDVEAEDDALVNFQVYDNDIDDWKNLGYLNPKTSAQEAKELNVEDLNTPFIDYLFLVNAQNPGTKITFYGRLVGNVDKNMPMKAHWWNSYGNSYMAEMDVKTLLDAVEERFSGSQENIALYVYQWVGGNQYNWTAITKDNYEDIGKLKLNPMEVFLIKNDGGAMTLPFDYESMVWPQN